MKYIKKYRLFESEEIEVGWRCQKSDKLHQTTGRNATEGEGYYLFYDRDKAESWMDNETKLFKVSFKSPKNPLIGPEFLHDENSFLFFGESDFLFEPITEDDKYWVQIHKKAIAVGGEDIALCNKELTRIIKSDGYDAVIINDDFQPWIIIMDDSLIVSSEIVN